MVVLFTTPTLVAAVLPNFTVPPAAKFAPVIVTYIAQPTVSSVAANNGLVAGETAVTITGANFAAGATVTFGGTAATNVVVVNSTTITATTPAGTVGAVT